MTDPKFIRVEAVREATGLKPRTLDRRLASGEIAVFRDPLDRRRRLIAVDDLDRLVNVTPFGRDCSATERVAS